MVGVNITTFQPDNEVLGFLQMPDVTSRVPRWDDLLRQYELGPKTFDGNYTLERKRESRNKSCRGASLMETPPIYDSVDLRTIIVGRRSPHLA